MRGRIRVHPAVVEAARIFGEEHSFELLAHRLGIDQSRLSTLLNHPVVATPRNRELIVGLATVVGAYVCDRAARYRPIVEQEEAA